MILEQYKKRLHFWTYPGLYIPYWTRSDIMKKIVSLGDCVISDNVDDILVSFALASCVALTVYSPSRKVLGMVHIVLPDSSLGPDDASSNPGYYADTAVPALLYDICSSYRCCLNELVVRIYGGADSINYNDVFLIGKRNITAVAGILNSNMIPFFGDETRGSVSRTVEIDVATGRARVEVQPIRI